MTDFESNGMNEVGVVIVSYEGASLISQCIDALIYATIPEEAIVLVDNGSGDETVNIVRERYSHVRVIRLDRNRGYGAACNIGIMASRNEYVLLVNNDATVTKNFLQGLLDCIRSDNRIGAVQSTILTHDSPPRIDSVGSFITRTGFLYHDRFGTIYPGDEVVVSCRNTFSAKGACLLLRRSALKEISLFDEDFFLYFEETDLCWRMWLRGFEVRVSGSSLAYHIGGATSGSLPSSFVVYHSFRNRITSLLKNLELRSLLSILPLHLLICLLLAAAYMIYGKKDCGAAILRAGLWNVKNLDSTMMKRGQIQRSRVLRDKVLFSYSSEGLRLKDLMAFGKVFFETWH